MDGISRRWDWCPSRGEGFMRSIVIRPDGDGAYYRFRRGEDRTRPSGIFDCERVD